MDKKNTSYQRRVMNEPSAAHAFLAVTLVVIGFFLSIITPVGTSRWYHVFFKLMMFMCFSMGFIFSIVSILKGTLLLVNKDSICDRAVTIAGVTVSLLIILGIITCLYSNPSNIDIFGITKKTPLPSPNIIQQW